MAVPGNRVLLRSNMCPNSCLYLTSFVQYRNKSMRISLSSFMENARSTVDESMYLITVLTSFLQARLNPRPLQVSRL